MTDKAMTRLEKLAYFTKKHEEFTTRMAALQMEANATDKEWSAWLESELGLTGNVHMAGVMKTCLETSFESSKIITC